MTAYFEVPQHFHSTQEGPVGLPILYYNTAAVFASFLVPIAAARALLPDALDPVTVAPGKGIATVAFFQYVDSSVGPYNEMGLAVGAHPAARQGFRDTAPWHPAQSLLPGMFVVELPVTTAAALAAGRELWGYPKIVTPIDFQLRGRELACAVRDDAGLPLCRLAGRTGGSLPLAAPNLMTYTQHEGRLLRTVINLRGRMQNAASGSVRLDCGRSDHHLSRHLRDLGLQDAVPVLVQSGVGLQALLPAGKAVR